MDAGSNELVNLFVNYAANVAADATRYGFGLISRTLRKKKAPENLAQRVNTSLQAELVGRGVSERSAVRAAEYILDRADLAYFLALWSTSESERLYVESFREELEAHLFFEADLVGEELRVVAAVLGEVLGGVGAAQTRSRSQARTDSYVDEISAPPSGTYLFADLGSRVQFLRTRSPETLTAILDFTKRYCAEVSAGLSAMRLQHLAARRGELPLDSLFVPPRFTSLSNSDQTLGTGELLGLSKRTVVLGPAGSGKSTAVRHAALKIAETFGGQVVPFVLELRTVVRDRGQTPTLFMSEIARDVTELMQEPPPEGWLEYLLYTGRGVVFFDGFDEVLQAGRRSEIRDAIRSFSQRFPASSVVITSRQTGYEIAPFPEEFFAHLRIRELEESQVQEYAHKWFALVGSASDLSDLTAEDFLEESAEFADELRVNPLMLSLLCSVYYSRGDIPRSLSELYEGCATLLYQQWNTMRGLEDHGGWVPEVRPAVYHIAALVLGNADYLALGIPMDALVRELQGFWVRKGLDEDEARDYARKLADLWAGRAWIVTAVSGDATNRPRFGFVHQSFLEYFAAVHYVRGAENAGELFSALRDRLIYANGWSVAQLAVSTFEVWRDDGGSKFVGALLDDVSHSPPAESLALLRFGCSLRGILRLPASDTISLVVASLSAFAASVVLPQPGQSLGDVMDASRELHDQWSSLMIDDDDDHSLAHVADAREAFATLVPSTIETEVLISDILEAEESSVSKTLREACLQFLDTNDLDASVIALSFLLEEVAFSGRDKASLASTFRDWVLSRVDDLSWLAASTATSVGLLRPEEAVVRIPWHALVVREPLLLSLRHDLLSPSWIRGDVFRLGRSALELDVLGAIGRSFMADQDRQGWPTALRHEALRDGFLVERPQSSVEEVDWDSWTDDQVFGYTVVLCLCVYSWGSGWLVDLQRDRSSSSLASIVQVIEGYGGSETFASEMPDWRPKLRDRLLELASEGSETLVAKTEERRGKNP